MGCQGSTNQAKKSTKKQTKGKATKQGQVMKNKNGKQQVNQMNGQNEEVKVSNSAAAKGSAPSAASDSSDIDRLVQKYLTDKAYQGYLNMKLLSLRLSVVGNKNLLQSIAGLPVNKDDQPKNALKVPPIKVFSLSDIDSSNQDVVQEFLNKSFPDSLELLALKVTASKSSLDIDLFLTQLTKVNSNITLSLRLHKFKIPKKSFESIINSFSHLREIWFGSSTIDSEDISFHKSTNFKLEKLVFHYSGTPDCSNWEGSPSKVSSIAKAINGCTLKDSLKIFKCINNKFKLSTLQEIFDENELSQIQIEHEDWDKAEDDQDSSGADSADSDEEASDDSDDQEVSDSDDSEEDSQSD
ncbi:unnamed protein product [Moneuplotes crassus]|uniref:Uncharacterized protein n=1 Tax=Euplotes crassus TaxID=5936 RepID=A0AAD2DAN2_EUPCR|nr:unnamed protein product [Moneuplotes crassus]